MRLDSGPATLNPTAVMQSIVMPDAIGVQRSTIPVELSTRFLEHFSEYMYSSPQKAFEELISNGWDALADHVDVRIPNNLSDPSATLSIFDNGESMDEEGLNKLWHIAFSPKRGVPERGGRKIIGKFGIGKLATYVLATKLTYICKASDGKIRRVTMDYSVIDKEKSESRDTLIRDLKLSLYEVKESEVKESLKNVYCGDLIFKLINEGAPCDSIIENQDEYQAMPAKLIKPSSKTWTLVVLSGLKAAGKELKIGILKRMLQTALPFRSSMAIYVNGERLESSKIDAPVRREWVIGKNLDFDSFDIDEVDDNDNVISKTFKLEIKKEPAPHVIIPGIGPATGTITLFEDKISGGKSDERGASNGFHINVLGRLINQSDATFGELNLNHSAWSRFRMAVRVDGLDQFLTTDREKFRERPEMKIFRAFIRKCFNMARNLHEEDPVVMSDGGDILLKSLGVISLSPLRNVVSEVLKVSTPPLPGLFDDFETINRIEKQNLWRDNTAENIRSALNDIKITETNDDEFVKFRLSDNSIVINKDHPFVLEHSKSKEEKELVRTVAMVSLLTDMYSLDIGINPTILKQIREYRDRLMRYKAMQQRHSGSHIARLLLQTQHDSANSKMLEVVLSDALRYLGFDVKDLAKPGEPEGIACAYSTPSGRQASTSDPNPPLYSFTFDAKSAKGDVAQTGNIKLDGIVEHRERYKANYALVVAPGFSDGALATRCAQQQVTPMTASGLGRLLEYTVEFGALPLTKLREVFNIYDPTEVSVWIIELRQWLTRQRPLTLDIFMKALELLKGQIPDVLAASTISFLCRTQLGAPTISEEHVKSLVKGLSVVIPDLIGIESDKIVVNASPERLAAAVAKQLEDIRDAAMDGA